MLDSYTEDYKGHGRVESRTVTVIPASAVKGYEKWKDIKTIIRCTLVTFKDGVKTEFDRFFISSLPANARRISNVIRKHWSIENNLHWVLDVIFNEDSSRAKKDNSPLDLNIMRKFALSLLSGVKSGRESYKKLMFRAAMSDEFLKMVFFKR